MKKLFKNLYNRFDVIWLLLKSDFYILIVDRPEPAAPTGIKRTIAANLANIEDISFLLSDSVRQINEVQQSVESLTNQLGIKRASEL